MRNDLTACDGPQLANAAPIARGGSRRRHTARGLLALALAMALIVPCATALAAEPATSGYGQTAPVKTTPAPKQETAPTSTSSTPKETTPAKETEPAKTSGEPTTTAKAKALPFTGLDLRWMTLGGVLLVAMGMSIVVVQRRRPGAKR